MRYGVCVCLHLGFRAKPTELQPCWQFALEIRHRAMQPGQTIVWVSEFSGHQPVLGTSVPQLCCNFPRRELHPAFPCHKGKGALRCTQPQLAQMLLPGWCQCALLTLDRICLFTCQPGTAGCWPAAGGLVPSPLGALLTCVPGLGLR